MADTIYIHTDVFGMQSPKKAGQPCGDAFGVYRDHTATTIVLSDGLGSGIKAHIAATMCVSRAIELIKEKMSLREAFTALTRTMDRAWGTGEPFAVFTLARILNTGHTTILTYEMPPPLIVTKTYAQLLRDRVYAQNKAIIHESTCVIGKGEGLMLVSDGITQAGIGKHFALGWESEGVRRFVQSLLPVERIQGNELAQLVHDNARSYWPFEKGDDCSVLFALNRRGVIVNLFSGPPENRSQDENWIKTFLQTEGIHIVCGGTSAKLIARFSHQPLQVIDTGSMITPPAYELDGIEVVTEGVVTLNQVFHLLDEDTATLHQQSAVSEVAWYLKMADRVNIWQGLAENVGDEQVEFRQQGLLNRKKILQKIVDKLQIQGKLVVVQSL